MAKRGRPMVTIALLFLAIAVMFSVVIWPDVSRPAKVAFFCVGFACGIFAGGFLASGRARG